MTPGASAVAPAVAPAAGLNDMCSGGVRYGTAGDEGHRGLSRCLPSESLADATHTFSCRCLPFFSLFFRVRNTRRVPPLSVSVLRYQRTHDERMGECQGGGGRAQPPNTTTARAEGRLRRCSLPCSLAGASYVSWKRKEEREMDKEMNVDKGEEGERKERGKVRERCISSVSQRLWNTQLVAFT